MHIKISEAPSRVGTVIPGIAGKLVKLWPQKSGTNANGDWAMQGGTLSDGVNSIDVTFKNMPELPQSMRDQEIGIESVGGKRGLTGVQIKKDEYKGESKIIVWVTGTALIKGGGSIHSEPKDAPQANVERKQGIPKEFGRAIQAFERQGTAPDNMPDVQAVRRRMMKTANLYMMARKAAEFIMKENGVTNEESIRACTATLFIQSADAGDIEKMPDTRMVPEGMHAKDQEWDASPVGVTKDTGPEAEDIEGTREDEEGVPF